MIRQSGASVIIGVLFYSIDFEKKKKINKQDASFGFFLATLKLVLKILNKVHTDRSTKETQGFTKFLWKHLFFNNSKFKLFTANGFHSILIIFTPYETGILPHIQLLFGFLPISCTKSSVPKETNCLFHLCVCVNGRRRKKKDMRTSLKEILKFCRFYQLSSLKRPIIFII